MPPVRRQTIETLGHDDPVVLWRTSRLREAGFEAQLADALGPDPAYDLHAVLELVDRGCPAEFAVRILAPLDRDA